MGGKALKMEAAGSVYTTFLFPLLCRKSLQDIHNLFLDAKIIFFV